MENTSTSPEYRAEARFQRSSPQKAKLVLDLIKGKPVGAALQTVSFTHKRIAPVVEGVLRSAVQNAMYLADERGLDLDVDRLYVKTAVANEGPRLKRLRPAPMGRAFRYQRRLTHIVVTVAEKSPADNSSSAAEAGSTADSGGASKASRATSRNGDKPSTKRTTQRAASAA